MIEKIKDKALTWLDEWGLAARGALLASKMKNFWLPAILTFIFFGTLMNLLASGFTAFKLIGASGFFGGIKIIFNAFLGIFGVNKNFLDWISSFFIIFIQSVLIGLVFFVYKKNKKKNQEKTSENLGNAGIVAGLAVLGAGCPTCGTTLLAPVIGTIFSGSSFALSGAISSIITILAVIVALLAFKKVGLESYVIIKSEQYERKKENNEKNR